MMRVGLSNVAAAVLVACASCAAVGASGQVTQERARPAPAEPSPRRETQGAPAVEPDLSITARVTAGELLFRKVPNPRVEFTGRPRRETVWESERQNLPDAVQPGVTYRDIGITLRITSVFADIDRIVAEALGEIPLSDDAAPRPGEQPRQESPPAPPATPPAQPLQLGVQRTTSETLKAANPNAPRQADARRAAPRPHDAATSPPTPTTRSRTRPRRVRGK